MGNEKKNRASQREDKDKSMASTDNSNTADGSLAARRARLRGSLARAGVNDPYAAGQAAAAGYGQDSYGGQTDEYGSQSYSTAESEYATEEQPQDSAYNVYGVPVEATPESTDADAFLSDLSSQLSSTAAEPFEPLPPPVTGGSGRRARNNAQAAAAAIAAASAPPDPLAEEPPATTETPAPAKASKPTPATAQTPIVVAAPAVDNEMLEKINQSVDKCSESMERCNESLLRLPAGQDKALEVLGTIDNSLSSCANNLQALHNISNEQAELLKGLNSTMANQTMMEVGLNLSSLTESLSAALEPMKALGELIPALDQLVLTLEGREAEKEQKLSPDDLVTSLSDQLSAGLIDPWTFKCAYMAVYPADHPADLLHRLVELLGTQRLSGDLFRAAYEAVQAAEAPPRAVTSPGGGGTVEVIRTVTDEAIKSQLEALQKANEELGKRQEERERELNELLGHKERELQNAQDLLNQKLEELNGRYEDTASILTSREDEFRAAIESKDMELIEKESELNMLRAQMEELRTNTQDMVKDLQKEMLKLREERMKEKEEAANRVPPPQEAKPAAAGFFETAPAGGGRNMFEPNPAAKPLFAGDGGGSAGFGSGESFGEGFVGPATPAQPIQPQPQQFQPAQSTQPLPVMQPGQPMPGQQLLQPGQVMQAPAQPTGFGSPTAFQPPQQPVFQPPQPVAPQPAPNPVRQTTPPGGSGPATTPLGGGGPSGPGSYGSGVRAQVFEVIVRQALAGAPWREICAGPMQVNNITPDEVEAEVKRRQAMLK